MFGNIDSKYRFIILASKRAKQLLKGAKPKIKGKSKSLIRIAQAEVRSGLIEYEILPTRAEEAPEQDERVFVGAGVAEDAGEPEILTEKDVPAAEGEEGFVEEPEEDSDESEDEDALDGEAKDDKDE